MQQIRAEELVAEGRAAGAAPFSQRESGDRGFRLALLLALLLHAPLFLGLIKAPVRQIGDPGGSVEGVDVDLVDAAELARMMSGAPGGAASPPPSPPVPPMEPSQPAQAAPPPPTETASLQEPARPTTVPPPPPQQRQVPQEVAEPAKPPAPPIDEKAAEKAPEAEPVSKPETKAESRAEPMKETPKAAEPPPKPETIDLADLMKPQILNLPPAPKQKEREKERERPKDRERPKEKEQKEKQKEARADPAPQRPKLDFSPPSSTSFSAPGGGAGVSRPAGITRSGENDDFARGVVAALRRTMPDSRRRLGRVTIKLILNEIGNVQSIELLSGSGVGSLDQDVQFAARQSNFPLPPRGATLIDRTFQITYIYR